KPCDIVAGLPIIPRFGLSTACENDILVAALLRQPIIPVTHHQDVAGGYDLLDSTASLINSLGDVSWLDMRSIARRLYSRHRNGSSLNVRLFSKKVTVSIPAGTTHICVE